MTDTQSTSFLAMLILVLLVLGCGTGTDGQEPTIVGNWQVDAQTQEWLSRACVVIDLPESETLTLQVQSEGSDYALRMNDTAGTTFAGSFRDRSFEGRQILPSTDSGRFCGTTIAVRVRLRVSSDGQTMTGTWRTPDCAPCPDRHFGANRAPELE